MWRAGRSGYMAQRRTRDYPRVECHCAAHDGPRERVAGVRSLENSDVRLLRTPRFISAAYAASAQPLHQSCSIDRWCGSRAATRSPRAHAGAASRCRSRQCHRGCARPSQRALTESSRHGSCHRTHCSCGGCKSRARVAACRNQPSRRCSSGRSRGQHQLRLSLRSCGACRSRRWPMPSSATACSSTPRRARRRAPPRRARRRAPPARTHSDWPACRACYDLRGRSRHRRLHHQRTPPWLRLCRRASLRSRRRRRPPRRCRRRL